MDRRGEVGEETMLSAGKMLFFVLIALVLAGVLFGMFRLFAPEGRLSAAEQDRDRVVSQLQALQPGQCISVPVIGAEYIIELYGAGSQQCKGKPCVCVQESPDEGKKCRIIERTENDCARGVCVPQQEPEVFVVKQGTPVPVCRAGNELHLGV